MVKIPAILLLIASSLPLAAQWPDYRDPGIPRTKDGKPNLSAPAPRAANGKPDLSGVWQADGTPAAELKQLFPGLFDILGEDVQLFSKYGVNILSDYKRADEPLRPEATTIVRQRGQSLRRDLPSSHCLPEGLPMSLLSGPFKFIQTPAVVVMLLDDNNPPRQIYTDGRKLPSGIDVPSWMGYSVGTWQRDTLVVDTVGFNGRTWLDAFGHPVSESMHIVERFRRRDFGHLDFDITFDDPKMYSAPFTVKFTAHLLPNGEILESVCAENEKDRTHIDR